jgi:hypothetical protein
MKAITQLEIPKGNLNAEVTVYHDVLQYAGTFDLMYVDRDGKRVLLDWKSGKRLYPEFALQMAAYAYAWEFGGGGKVDRMVCVRVGEGGEFEIEEHDHKDELFEVFKAALTLYRWKNPIKEESNG